MGVNIEALLHRCQVAEQICAHYDSSESNSGLWLGAAIGELARQGRDKLTFVVSPPIESFGLWVEQLVAESTGKHGRGILPVADEPLGDSADVYGDDRVFVYLRNGERARRATSTRRSSARRRRPSDDHAAGPRPGRPRPDLLPLRVRGRGRRLGARDQPVRPAQRAGGQGQHQRACSSRGSMPVDRGRRRRRAARAAGRRAAAALRGDPGLPAAVRTSSTRRSPSCGRAIRAATGAATTFGYGPRFLHSTGQLHKGGPPTGRFLQLVDAARARRRDPGAGYSFGTLIAAQAAGDLRRCARTGCRPSGSCSKATRPQPSAR